tara:strand:- start:741 stop:974 length:234 start_codon:yes stop_codon:yes gene_type:complete
MATRKQVELVHRFNIDPGSVYDMTREELEIVQMEVGEREHILDALVKLGASSMTEEQLLYARAEAIGCSVQDIIDFG